MKIFFGSFIMDYMLSNTTESHMESVLEGVNRGDCKG